MINLSYEQQFFSPDIQTIAGVDEAGRGPLAGPVVAAAVSLKPDWRVPNELKEVKDSKKLSAKKRAILYEQLISLLPGYGIGLASHIDIDRLNILQATFLAMRKAVQKNTLTPDFILVDGNFVIPQQSQTQLAVIKGDSLVFAIAAASILAKETRDRLMDYYHDLYPQYGFDQHRGYGTKNHLAAIAKYGPCPIHRLSFAPLKNIKAL